jgi:hypothetical protein
MSFVFNLYSINITSIKYFLSPFLCFFLLFTSSACSPNAESKKAVVIRVGDQVVTVEDIEREVNIASIENSISENKIWSSINELVNQMVDDSLVLEYGKEHDISLNRLELEKAVQNIIKDYPDDSFDEMLLSKCIDVTEWKDRFSKHLLIKKIIKKQTESLPPASHQSIKSYYQENKEDFSHPARSKFVHIITKTKNEAEALLNRLKEGEGMKELAKDKSLQYGIYTDYGKDWKTKDILPPSLSNTIFSIPIGKTSQIIKTPYGFHIIKVLKRESPGVKDILEVKNEIENRLRAKAIQRLYTAWLQELRNSYSVTINHALLDNLREIHEKN